MKIKVVIPKDLINDITICEMNLRRYAHGNRKSCEKYLRECPEQCKDKHNLNLDTALAWMMANAARKLVNNTIYRNECEFSKIRFNNIKFSVYKDIETMMYLHAVIGLHKKSYKKLFALAEKLIRYGYELNILYIKGGDDASKS